MIFPLPLSALLSSPFFCLDFELPPLASTSQNSLSCTILRALHSEILSLHSKKSSINRGHEFFSFLFSTSDLERKTTFMCEAFYIACVRGIMPLLTFQRNTLVPICYELGNFCFGKKNLPLLRQQSTSFFSFVHILNQFRLYA